MDAIEHDAPLPPNIPPRALDAMRRMCEKADWPEPEGVTLARALADAEGRKSPYIPRPDKTRAERRAEVEHD